MSDGPLSLLDALRLADSGARTTEDIVVGEPMAMPHHRAFGGQVLAQAILAAARTVPADRELHSIHGYFLRPGSTDESLTYAIDRIHDGRSFSTRRAQAFQSAAPIFSMIASFQEPDGGLEHQEEIDLGSIPAPEDLPTLQERYGHMTASGRVAWVLARPFDIRHTSSPIFVSVEGERQARQSVWMRAVETLPDDPTIHRAALAFGSDYSILEAILRRHGVPWATPGITIASLDHAMWFHRDARADDWILFTQDAPSAQNSRGLSFGRMYDRAGRLVATVAQEGLLRVPEELVSPVG